MEIKHLVENAHFISQNKGFWDIYDEEGLDSPQFDESRTHQRTHQRTHLSQKLMLIVSEVSEAMEALRKNDVLSHGEVPHVANIGDPEIFKDHFEGMVKNSFGDELADVFIRLGDLCGKLGIDIESHIKAKMRYNEMRQPMHGKNF